MLQLNAFKPVHFAAKKQLPKEFEDKLAVVNDSALAASPAVAAGAERAAEAIQAWLDTHNKKALIAEAFEGLITVTYKDGAKLWDNVLSRHVENPQKGISRDQAIEILKQVPGIKADKAGNLSYKAKGQKQSYPVSVVAPKRTFVIQRPPGTPAPQKPMSLFDELDARVPPKRLAGAKAATQAIADFLKGKAQDIEVARIKDDLLISYPDNSPVWVAAKGAHVPNPNPGYTKAQVEALLQQMGNKVVKKGEDLLYRHGKMSFKISLMPSMSACGGLDVQA